MEGVNSIPRTAQKNVTELKNNCKEIADNETHSVSKNMSYPESSRI